MQEPEGSRRRPLSLPSRTGKIKFLPRRVEYRRYLLHFTFPSLDPRFLSCISPTKSPCPLSPLSAPLLHSPTLALDLISLATAPALPPSAPWQSIGGTHHLTDSGVGWTASNCPTGRTSHISEFFTYGKPSFEDA